MYKRLEEILKKSNGNIFTVCLDDKLLDILKNKENINLYSLSSNDSDSIFGLGIRKKNKPKYKKNNKGKTINIKKIRKEINKKSVNYTFCNMDEIFTYYKHFIRDSIYMTDGKIYLYFSKNIDKNFIISRYQRYNVKIKDTEYKTGFIIEIDSKGVKNKFFKEKVYFIIDTFYNIADFIGNIMIS